MSSDTSLIALLGFATLLPFIIACGTCYIKFSIVFTMVRNALGIQQVPNNMTLNGIALVLSLFVMKPIVEHVYVNWQKYDVDKSSPESITHFVETGLGEYKDYLFKYSEEDLVIFFSKAESPEKQEMDDSVILSDPSIFSLLPAYALSEIKSAFKIAFYIYLPFVIVDLLVSSILLSLGMMMMSPVMISIPIKLILFVVLDGWTLLSKGMILQYLDLIT